MASKGDPKTKAMPYKPRPRSTFSGPGEPKTLEGRARKKLQMGRKAGFGCVLSHKEMLLVIAQLPEGWLEGECK